MSQAGAVASGAERAPRGRATSNFVSLCTPARDLFFSHSMRKNQKENPQKIGPSLCHTLLKVALYCGKCMKNSGCDKSEFSFFANRFLFSLFLIKFLFNLTTFRKIDSIRNNVSTKHNQIHFRARGLSGGWVGPGRL